MGIGEIFSKGLTIFGNNFADFAILGLIFMIPYGFIDGLLTLTISTQPNSGMNIGQNLVSIIFLLVYIGASVDMIHIASERIKGNTIKWKEALSYGYSKWAPAFIVGLAVGLATFGLSLLFIIPGIIFGVYWTFALYATILKEKNVGESISYSKAIVKGRWWRLLGFILSVGVLGFILMLIIAVPIGIMMLLPVVNIIGNIIMYFIYHLISAAMTCVMTVLFLNWDAHRTAA